MSTLLKNSFKIAFIAFLLFGIATITQKTTGINQLSKEIVTAEKPLFGAQEYKYEPIKVKTEAEALESKIKWSLFVCALLIIFILANVFDIQSLISKITGREAINGNNVNKWIMLIFLVIGMICAAWEFVVHGKLILYGGASSEHGVIYDQMFSITMILTTIVFVITEILLFGFAFMYARKPNRKAYYYAHNNKLEVFWTLIPAIVLTILILKGHKTWQSIMYADEKYENANKIEVFAEQFAWTVRYAGNDGKLGVSDYKFISGTNKLGLAYEPAVDELVVELNNSIEQDKKNISNIPANLADLKNQFQAADGLKDYKTMESLQEQIEQIETGEYLDELNASIKRKTVQLERIKHIKETKTMYASTFTPAAKDDIITQELHLPVGKPVTLLFRSRDIIHSAWIPHFRVQMNVVPGMPTKFTFIPTKTTKEAKAENGEEFEYYLYCNKICGVSHFNMKLKVVIESENSYKRWLKKQQPIFAAPAVIVTPDASSTDSTKSTTDSLTKSKLAIR